MVEERDRPRAVRKPYPVPPHIGTAEHKTRTLALILAVLCSAIAILGSAQLASHERHREGVLGAILLPGEHRWALIHSEEKICIGYFKTALDAPHLNRTEAALLTKPEDLFLQSTVFELEGLLPIRLVAGTYLAPIRLTAQFNSFLRLDAFEGRLLSGRSELQFVYSAKENELSIKSPHTEAPLYLTEFDERIVLMPSDSMKSYSLRVPRNVTADIERLSERSSAIALRPLIAEDGTCEGLPPLLESTELGFALEELSDPMLVEIIHSSLQDALETMSLDVLARTG